MSLVVFFISALLLGLFAQVPPIYQSTVLARQGEAVKLHVPPVWMESITAEILTSHCTGRILTVDCDHLRTTTTNKQGSNADDGVYLIKQSIVTFDLSKYTENSKVQVWLFPTQAAAKDGPGTQSCYKPPRNTYCDSPDPTSGTTKLHFTIQFSSYYFLRCLYTSDDISCGSQITIDDNNLAIYDFNSTILFAIDQNILDQNGKTPHAQLKMRNSFLSINSVCVLAQLTQCGEEEKDPKIEITAYRRSDVLIVLVVLLLLSLTPFLLLGVVALFYLKRHCESKSPKSDNNSLNCDRTS